MFLLETLMCSLKGTSQLEIYYIKSQTWCANGGRAGYSFRGLIALTIWTGSVENGEHLFLFYSLYITSRAGASLNELPLRLEHVHAARLPMYSFNSCFRLTYLFFKRINSGTEQLWGTVRQFAPLLLPAGFFWGLRLSSLLSLCLLYVHPTFYHSALFLARHLSVSDLQYERAGSWERPRNSHYWHTLPTQFFFQFHYFFKSVNQ